MQDVNTQEIPPSCKRCSHWPSALPVWISDHFDMRVRPPKMPPLAQPSFSLYPVLSIFFFFDISEAKLPLNIFLALHTFCPLWWFPCQSPASSEARSPRVVLFLPSLLLLQDSSPWEALCLPVEKLWNKMRPLPKNWPSDMSHSEIFRF